MSFSIALLLTLLLFVAWGLGMAFISRKLAKAQIRERSEWSTVQGTVISSEVSYRGGYTDSESGHVPGRWFVIVQVAYEVAGVGYFSSQKWGMETDPRNQYLPGADVTVYYNPTRPGEAVVKPDEPSGEGLGCLALATGIMTIILILIIWIWSLT
ncbi:MAG: hypothetical protein A2144_04900 [Chloroflexi bacterium RBG_16_50_9]|nr:MAG: hypothetical protein A2144_04900 [Chloroflexi bacterium RBG_16_50_9]